MGKCLDLDDAANWAGDHAVAELKGLRERIAALEGALREIADHSGGSPDMPERIYAANFFSWAQDIARSALAPGRESFEEWHARECPRVILVGPGHLCTDAVHEGRSTVWSPDGVFVKFVGNSCREAYAAKGGV